MTPLRVGLAGLGTVGGAVAKLIVEHGETFAVRCGRPLVLSAVSPRYRAKPRGSRAAVAAWLSDRAQLARSAPVDVFVELIGGEGDPAHAAIAAALARGLPVVTANKAVLAHHGVDLAMTAEEKRGALNFEAAVAGGIPIVK